MIIPLPAKTNFFRLKTKNLEYLEYINMSIYDEFGAVKIPLNDEAGRMPVLGFGSLIPDPATTISATRDALVAGFRHFDCAERYRNEREVGDALRAGLASMGIGREVIF